MKKAIGMVALGLGGLAAAIGLTVGALALAGDDVGTVVQPTLSSSGSDAPSAARSMSPSRDDASETPSASPDDHGGSDDPPGSDDSGSGSDNSGPGSDSSGSGSSGSDDD